MEQIEALSEELTGELRRAFRLILGGNDGVPLHQDGFGGYCRCADCVLVRRVIRWFLKE